MDKSITKLTNQAKAKLMYEIDTDIPIPRRPSINERYPWYKLEVGHSFFVSNGSLKSLRSSASQMKAKTKHKYLVRAVDDGIRVWRIA